MAGNVWEWGADHYDGGAYDRYKRGDLLAPQAASRDGWRVARGASWHNDDTYNFRCAYRIFNAHTLQRGRDGFRCARTLP